MKALKAKKQILRSQISNARSRNNERQLERELSIFFSQLGDKVKSNMNEYWNDNLLIGQVDIITKPINDAHAEYYHILQKYIKREYKLGQDEALRLVKLTNKNYVFKAKRLRLNKAYNLFGTLRRAEEELFEKVFISSKRTLARVTSDINRILVKGYTDGKGIDVVANMLTRRFDQLETWEAKRIARTEIHNAHTNAIHEKYRELGVEYTMWITAHDDRVRGTDPKDEVSHVELDGEITRLDNEFSNGLKFPGDTNGELLEWINCRCSEAPYVIPYGYIAPDLPQFREDDLIKIK